MTHRFESCDPASVIDRDFCKTCGRQRGEHAEERRRAAITALTVLPPPEPRRRQRPLRRRRMPRLYFGRAA